MRIGVLGVEQQRFLVGLGGRVEPSRIVQHVGAVVVGFEVVGGKRDGLLVERKRFGQAVARVVEVAEIDQRGDQVRVGFEGAAVELLGLVRLLVVLGVVALLLIGVVWWVKVRWPQFRAEKVSSEP